VQPFRQEKERGGNEMSVEGDYAIVKVRMTVFRVFENRITPKLWR